MSFDADRLRLIDDAWDVRIETARPDGSLRRTTIWIVVDGTDVFVRSVRGDRGYWFQAAADADEPLTLLVGRERMALRAVLAGDPDSVARTNRALERKYAGDPSLASMLQPKTLATTLRLEPT